MERREIVHSYGEVQVCHWWEAEQTDDSNINQSQYAIVDPAKMVQGGDGAKGPWACTHCGQIEPEMPMKLVGDEVHSHCRCGGWECFIRTEEIDNG